MAQPGRRSATAAPARASAATRLPAAPAWGWRQPSAGRVAHVAALSVLMALCTLAREARLSNAEEVVHGCAIDLLDDRDWQGH